ncbi:MAG: membrane protein insertion efficiency factor YidD [Spirochaetota bacterium]
MKKTTIQWQPLVRNFLIMLCMITTTPLFADFPPWDADVTVAHETRVQRRTPTVYNAAQAIGYFFIRMFQVIVSPQDGPNCRFTPTCSEYGRQAVMRYGIIVGGFLAGDRLIRCNPYTIPQHDPVPQHIR